ncbi:MAG TPA: hypothetical protein VIP28_06635 [Nocardioides sp.]
MEIVRDEPGPEKRLQPVPDPEPTSTYVKWSEPPAEIPSRLEKVTAELQRRPGEWALIALKSSPLMAWWYPLLAHPDFEVATRHVDPDNVGLVLAPRDVYARFVRRDLGGAPAD